MTIHIKISYSNQFILTLNKERLSNIRSDLLKGYNKIYTTKEAELLLLHYGKDDKNFQRVKDIDMI